MRNSISKGTVNIPPLVSIVVPVYNAQEYLQICIDSILAQTYKNYEVIFIDDGSTDQSAEIIKRYMLDYERIKLIQIPNGGQGAARNLAVNHASGKYILFLDADDYIESVTLECAVKRAEADKSDFVVFDWRYYTPEKKKENYCNADPIFSNKVLIGEECTKLLASTPIYSVNKLYRKDLLDKNKITYEEGVLYEDNPFQVKAILCAEKISLIHSPLYRVTISNTSSTKTNHDTDIHCTSFISAMHKCLDLLKTSEKTIDDSIISTFLGNFFDRFVLYYHSRTPDRYKKEFATDFVDLLSTVTFVYKGEKSLFSECVERGVFSNKKYTLFLRLINRSQKKKKSLAHTSKWLIKGSKRFGVRVVRVFRPSFKKKKRFTGPAINYDNVILFMGFDYRYTGNSRYLFDRMLKDKPLNKIIFYATTDLRVPKEYRVEPHSPFFDFLLRKSKVVIFESWIPNKFKKNPSSIWIQLWHGTPLKRVCFDSHEKCITEINTISKKRHYKDILRWDYLLVDTPAVIPLFQTAFLFNPKRMLPFGYPRVHYLRENCNREDLKVFIKDRLGIAREKKVVVYLPTWRDYNYAVEEENFDIDYLLDLQELNNQLGEDYVVVYKDHPYLSASERISFPNYCDVETQELLLISDCLISDYSSALFDAIAINIPIVLYCKDFQRNEETRGVYPEVWDKVKPYCCESIASIVEMIKDYPFDEHYMELKREYSLQNYSSTDFMEFIYSL